MLPVQDVYKRQHCYNITVNKLTPKSVAYNPNLTTDDDMRHLVELAERLRHRPGVEAVALSQNCFPYNDGSNGCLLYTSSDAFFRCYSRLCDALIDG